MRYRIYNSENIVSVMNDREYFHDRFHGLNPNKPVNGILEVDERPWIIVGYEEIKSESFTENEFHEIERDYFVNVFVESMACCSFGKIR